MGASGQMVFVIFLFNSNFLKQRRAGLATDVSASELQRTFKEGGNSSLQKGQAVIRYLLQIGFSNVN